MDYQCEKVVAARTYLKEVEKDIDEAKKMHDQFQAFCDPEGC